MISKKDYSQKYNCLLCNKFYTSRQFFCNHKNIYHKNEYKYNSKVAIMQSSATIKQSSNIAIEKSNNIYKCNFCNNIYKHLQSKYKHQKICKYNNSNNKKNC